MLDKNDGRPLHSSFARVPPGKKHPMNALNEPNRSHAAACRAVLSADCTVDYAVEALSTSELITLALAFGRADLLPKPYTNFRAAWRRLDDRQSGLCTSRLAANGRGNRGTDLAAAKFHESNSKVQCRGDQKGRPGQNS